jgi:short-subunit dehydrogenase
VKASVESNASRHEYQPLLPKRSFVTTSIAGKVAWLTGATSGIGEALAYALAADGANVVLSARRAEELGKVQAACDRSDEHLALPLDLLQPDTFESAVRTVLERFGHVDILIHCAGISQRGTAVETQMHVTRHVMAVNYFGPVALTKLVLPSMMERRSGHIVAISSLLGKFGVPERAAYCASKHAIIGFFDSLRAEVHEYGINVTVVCPGFVRTNASYNALSASGTPYGKMDQDVRNGLPSDVCAGKILAAIKSRKREVYIGGKERWSVYVNRYLPELFSRLVRRRKLK